MFTRQKKGWSLLPRAAERSSGSVPLNPRDGSGMLLNRGNGKGKEIAVAEARPPPPQASPGDDKGAVLARECGEEEVWRSFREAGFLDESVLQRRNCEAFAQRISDLEKELYDYQYNMGLLLIEKNEWASKYEEIRKGLAEAEETLKRERAAHWIARSELERQDENMRKALGVEKQSIIDLKALHEESGENAEAKFMFDKKLVEIHALEASIGDGYLEIKGKLHSAVPRLAEESQKNPEMGRKLEDVEAYEHEIQKESTAFTTGKRKHEELTQQREELRSWEQKLQDRQKKLDEEEKFLDERENEANERDIILIQDEEELEEARKEMEVANNSLKNKEKDINAGLEALDAKEKLEIQKLLDDHNMILDSKKQEFEWEMEKKRNIFDQVVKDRLDAVEKKSTEINIREVQIFNKEQDLEIELQKLKDKEKKFNEILDALKEREDSIRKDENKLQDEKEKLARDTQKLLSSQTELENSRNAMEAERLQTIREKENLKVAKEERAHHLQLQSKLEQEIGDYRIMKESHRKETEELRKERDRLEKVSEVLDNRKLALETELKQLNVEKERFEKWQCVEEGKLKKERLESTIHIQRVLEELRLIKETFGKSLVHQLDPVELFKKKYADIKDADALKIHKLNPDQDWLEGDKELYVCRNKREAEQLDIQKDISILQLICKNLKNQQEVVIKEKERIFALAEQLKCCKNCGFKIDDADIHGIQIPNGTEGSENILLSTIANDYLKEPQEGENTDVSPQGTSPPHVTSRGCESLLQKCSSLFSHRKVVNQSSDGHIKKSCLFDAHLDAEALDDEVKFQYVPSFSVANAAVDMCRARSVGGVSYDGESKGLGKANDVAKPSFGVADISTEMMKFQSANGATEMEGVPNFPLIHEQNGREGSFLLPETNSQLQASKQRQHQSSSSAGSKIIKRTNSVKAVIEDAKAITGVNSEEKHDKPSNGEDGYSQYVHEESRDDSVHDDQVASNAEQNTHFSDASGLTNSELDAGDGEVHSESVSCRAHRKRRQTTSPGTVTPGVKRYNLRRSTIMATMTTAQGSSNQSKGQKK
ncbi:nuclear matrix constituent protein 1-like [Elaeis guineensis]|uniref:nuclear matrix constituent protein 1-like n=1 Tax=Elaeis guineensis var. tenera TaxID=51953 RepID=UPI003C6D3199